MTSYCRECGQAHERNSDFCRKECASSFKKRRRSEKGKCRLCGRGFKGKIAVPREALQVRLADGGNLKQWLSQRRLAPFLARRAANGNGTIVDTVPRGHNVTEETVECQTTVK